MSQTHHIAQHLESEPFTPTQLDYEPTLMDTDSQPEEEEPDYEPTLRDTQPEEESLECFIEQDTLLHLWEQPPVVLLPAHQGDSDSEWDSQLTANENPNEPEAPLHHVLFDDHEEGNPSIKHWSLDPNFLSSVNAVLEKMDNEPWFNAEFLIKSDLTDFDKCFMCTWSSHGHAASPRHSGSTTSDPSHSDSGSQVNRCQHAHCFWV